MLAKEREAEILSQLKKHGAVTVSELVSRFGVSLETVRRDLLALEREGKLLRVHGGAVGHGRMSAELGFEERHRTYEREKRATALAALSLIESGDVIAIDTGSTAIYLAREILKSVENITVITPSLEVFSILSAKPSVRVILTGGTYLPEERCFIGALAEGTVASVRVRTAFVFPTAISLEDGVTDFNEPLLSMQKALIASSDRVCLVADSSKFEKRALYRLSPLTPEQTVVTDAGLPAELAALYRENGLDLKIGEIQ